MHVYCSLCLIHLPIHERSKHSPHSTKCVFLGSTNDQKGFLYHDPEARRTRILRNVVFLEHVPFYSIQSSSQINQVSCLPTFSNSSFPTAPLNVQFQCSKPPPYRTVSRCFSITEPNPPPSSTSLLDPSILWLATHKGNPPDRYGFPLLSTILDSIPSYYLQVGKEPCWQNTMAKELLALKANHTWDLVPWPDFLLLEASGSTPLKSSDGTLDQYKAHLVAQGFKQE